MPRPNSLVSLLIDIPPNILYWLTPYFLSDQWNCSSVCWVTAQRFILQQKTLYLQLQGFDTSISFEFVSRKMLPSLCTALVVTWWKVHTTIEGVHMWSLTLPRPHTVVHLVLLCNWKTQKYSWLKHSLHAFFDSLILSPVGKARLFHWQGYSDNQAAIISAILWS